MRRLFGERRVLDGSFGLIVGSQARAEHGPRAETIAQPVEERIEIPAGVAMFGRLEQG